MSGGGGGSTYYANLERLYGAQADNADQLRGESAKTFADLANLRNAAADYGSLANQEQAASTATADYRDAAHRSMVSMTDNLASLGINPADERYMRNLRSMETDLMGSGAGAITGARNRAADKGFAMMSDVTNMGLGLPGQATSAFNSAGNMASSAGQMRMNEASMNNNAMAGLVRGGMDTAILGKYMNWWANGGYVNKYAKGGVVGAMESIQAPSAPVSAPTPDPLVQAAGMGAQGAMTYKMLTKPNPVDLATKQVNSVIPATGLESSNAVNGWAGTDIGAGEGAALAGGAQTGTAISAEELLPLLFAANGGQVTPFSRGAKGGEVDGPGGPKDDQVPAMLSDGEFVLPVGTVKKYGLAKLEKMRQEGLEFERQLGIGARA